ncbi:von Willebrand factor D and EGF domain-containing protein-like [Homalodisca vitripennis]|uniref:von Willebrand factor D and EGF domain-containing protein-like n=1 Tax=Homalodisca vitripennis TaxID=197043 RepID=UPI001EEADE8F|nr:von Willebrand factor D and EGF domain-containing protein-like [Homalodisca vitripennis]
MECRMWFPTLVLFIGLLYIYKPCAALRGFKDTQMGLCTVTTTVTRSMTMMDWKRLSSMRSRSCGFLWSNTCYDTVWNTEYVPVYIDYTEQEMETVCCGGYSNTGGECVPVCSRSCAHSECVAPETWSCNSGYKKSDWSSCVCDAVCNKDCEHGECTSPNFCSCHAGYQKHPFDNYVCLPVCNKTCENSKCTAPNVCSCNIGYIKDPSDSYKCNPICSKECKNGRCTAPDVCSCNYGYEKDNLDSYRCNPVCRKKCQFGECTAPEICSCDDGYEKRYFGQL